MKTVITDLPTSYVLISFFAVPLETQLKALNVKVTNLAGRQINTILVLSDLIRDMDYFFDHYTTGIAGKDSEFIEKIYHLDHMLISIDEKTNKADEKYYTLHGFMYAKEWQDIRELAKEMLLAVKLKPCEIPIPLPLNEWIDFTESYLEEAFEKDKRWPYREIAFKIEEFK